MFGAWGRVGKFVEMVGDDAIGAFGEQFVGGPCGRRRRARRGLLVRWVGASSVFHGLSTGAVPQA